MTLRMSLLGLSAALMLTALAMVFFYAPTDIVLGVSQRIFYVHVPLALVGFLAFAVVAVCSIGYLWKGSERMDNAAYAAAEIGVLFTSLMLITGMLWAKPAWGVLVVVVAAAHDVPHPLVPLRRLPHAAGLRVPLARPPRATPPSSASSASSTSPSCTWPRGGGATCTRTRSSAPSPRSRPWSRPCSSRSLSASWAFTALFAWLMSERTELRRQEIQVERMRYTYGEA